LFGGINRIFVDRAVKSYFEERGVLAKTTEMTEFMCFLEYEDILRLRYRHGELDPSHQCSVPGLLGELLWHSDTDEVIRALRARVHIGLIEMLDSRWREIAAQSGLLFAPHVSFHKVEDEGHSRISLNGYTEAPMTIGRYAAQLKMDVFDGFVNLSAFNCGPGSSASAVIQSLSLQSDASYAVLEADGDCIPTDQLRQLEAMVAHCHRRRSSRAAVRH
jgi:predicted nucleotide-binding protein (sugar kinase/HSP70/actin superfamily)